MANIFVGSPLWWGAVVRRQLSFGQPWDFLIRYGAFVPVWLGIFLSELILWPVCSYSKTSGYCIGLGFDDGPLQWLEYGCVFLSLILFYGLVFWVVYRLLQYIKKRKTV